MGSQSSGTLRDAFRDLGRSWQQAQGAWKDARARHFEKEHWQPLEATAERSISEIEQYEAALERIRRTCP